MNTYIQKLHLIPALDNGCHTALLGVANCGIREGLSEEQIFENIRQCISNGTHHVPDSEIYASISKAKSDYIPYWNTSRKPFKSPTPKFKVLPAYRDHLLEKGKGAEEVNFFEASYIRLPDSPQKIQNFYYKCFLFIPQYDTKIQTVAQWLDFLKNNPTPLPFICPNPVDGQLHLTKSGIKSYRCDEAVFKFKFAVLEFNSLSHNERFAFWEAACNKLSMVALIDSDSKSLHG